jgi:basic membrane protein A
MYKNLAALAAACFSYSLSASLHAQAPKPPTQAAFVYVSPITEAGWTRQHDDARKAVEAALNKAGQAPQVVTRFVENVAEGPDAERVIRDLARNGADIIFTPSFRLHGAHA